MYVTTDIEINEDEMAEAIANSRYFTSAVEDVVENMDLGTPVEQALDYLGTPNEDRVDDIARDVAKDVLDESLEIAADAVVKRLQDEGVLRDAQVGLAAQARIEALEKQVLRLEGTLARVADVLLGKPVEQIVDDAIALGPIGG